jgi:phosphoglycolate phosphatase
MSAPTIVFDLDGTLVDTAPDLVSTLNAIFTREGFAPLAYEAARNLVGGGARAMIARGIEAEGRALSSEKLEQLFADFIAHYSEHLADRSRPFRDSQTRSTRFPHAAASLPFARTNSRPCQLPCSAS